MNKLFTKLFLMILAVLCTAEVMAQVPQGFNFQAVARDAEGKLIANSDLGVRVSVLQGAEDGTAVYTETQTPSTNEVGLFQLVIGEGTSENEFSAIDWSADNYYVKLEIDPAGGTEYEELGTTRLLSVPYALLAQNVVNGGGNNSDMALPVDFNGPNGTPSVSLGVSDGDNNYGHIDLTNAAGTALANLNVSNLGDTASYGNLRLDDTFENFSTTTPTSFRINRADGTSSGLFSSTLQYYNEADEGVFNWYGKGGMQVANPAYANGERSAGMSGGYFYMDIYHNGNFYAPLQYGISNAAEGGVPWFNLSTLQRQIDGKGSVFSINVPSDPSGNDPGGHSAEMMMFGTNSPNIQMGGQVWENNDLPYLSMFGSTGDGGEWFHSNVYIGVASDGTDQWGNLSITKTNIAGQTGEETVHIDGNAGNIDIAGVLTQSSDVRLKKDIKTLDDALENTMELRGVSYTWKTDKEGANPQIGVIAQEIEKIYPEFVRTDDDGMKSVNYAQMTAVLIEAVKSLNQKIQGLETDNNNLQAKVNKLQEVESRLAEIEGYLKIKASSKSLATN